MIPDETEGHEEPEDSGHDPYDPERGLLHEVGEWLRATQDEGEKE